MSPKTGEIFYIGGWGPRALKPVNPKAVPFFLQIPAPESLDGVPGFLGSRVLTFLAAPFSELYGLGARLRRRLYRQGWFKTRTLPAPVVSVGNLTVGGTGKTPLTASLARWFQAQGLRVAVLSRGYGGRRREVTCLADGERLYYKPPVVGEEAFWLARHLPGVLVYTGASRHAAGLAAWQDHRPDLFLLDDGFQHLPLARDLDILLLDAGAPLGNGRLLPAGPLREVPATLGLADALVLTRFSRSQHQEHLDHLRRLFPELPIFTAVIEPQGVRGFPGGESQPLEVLRGLAALAFAGLARPRVFQETLIGLGVDLRAFRAFPDHHVFTSEELAALVRQARSLGCQALITTSKDWARLGEDWPQDFPLLVLEVAARVDPEPAWQDFLKKALDSWPGSAAAGKAAFSLKEEKSSPWPLPPKVRRAFRELVRRGPVPANPATVWEILVRAPNWVGDAVMSLPVLAGLTRLFPEAALTVLAVPRVTPLFAGLPGVKEVIIYPKGAERWRLLRGLRKKYDLALALPNSWEAAFALWLTEVPHRLGYAADGRSPFLTLTLQRRRRLRGLHQVYYYLGLLTALGEVKDFNPPRLTLSPSEREAGWGLLAAAGLKPERPLVGLAPGAAFGPAKRWPPEAFAAVADRLQEESGANVVLLGGPEDREAAIEVQRHSRGNLVDLSGRTTLRQALMVLSRLQVLISNDSGLMHAAAALEVPVVALFGSTDPKVTGPFTRRATVLYQGLPCSPCLRRTCKIGYPCLSAIRPEEVFQAASLWLKEAT